MITRLPRRTRYQFAQQMSSKAVRLSAEISLITPRLCRSRYQIRIDTSPLAVSARYQFAQQMSSKAVMLSAEISLIPPRLCRSRHQISFIKFLKAHKKMSTLIFRVLIFLKPEYIFLTVFTCHIQRIRLCNLHIGIFNHVVVILNLICLKDSIF